MRVTEQAHEAVKEFVREGDIAIDATAGNGHDTLFLAHAVGPTGHVFSFDIQQEALDATLLLVSTHKYRHVSALRKDHAEMWDAIPAKHRGQVAAVMFNLGYLPGGNKFITTAPGSTFTALHAAKLLLRKEGILCVTVYRGHPQGPLEAEAVTEVMLEWSRQGDAVLFGPDLGPTAPQMITCVKLM